MNLSAIVLAAGQGTRLHPYTEVLPKSLFYVGNKPCIKWITDDLKEQGIGPITLCVNEEHLELFKHEFRDEERIFSSISPKKNTSGELLNALDGFHDERFLIVYADDLTYTNYNKMLEYHEMTVNDSDVIGTLGVTGKNKLEVGVMKTQNGIIQEFYEKPNISRFGWTSWTGRAIFEKEIIQYLKNDEDIASNVFPQILERLSIYETNSEWLDIGNIQHYKRANEKAKAGKLW